MNRVELEGHLGQDPELRYTPKGQATCTLSIATTETWKGQDGTKQQKTEWHRVVVWGKQAENCNQYLSKGSKIRVSGKLQTRSYDDKNGIKRYVTEVVVSGPKSEVVFGSHSKNREEASEQAPKQQRNPAQNKKQSSQQEDNDDMLNNMPSYDDDMDSGPETDTNFNADDIPF